MRAYFSNRGRALVLSEVEGRVWFAPAAPLAAPFCYHRPMSKLKSLGAGKSGLDLLPLMQQPDNRAAMAVTLDMRIRDVESGRVVLGATPGRHLENTAGVAQGDCAASLL